MQIGLSSGTRTTRRRRTSSTSSSAATSFRPGSDASINIAGFCDKPIQAKMDKAVALGATDPTGAERRCGRRSTRTTTDRAAAGCRCSSAERLDFVSKRVGNFQFSAQYYMLLDQAWVQ